jgi:hypothetical protein
MRSVLTLLRERRDSGNFKWDADKEKKAKEAIERRKREEVSALLLVFAFILFYILCTSNCS